MFSRIKAKLGAVALAMMASSVGLSDAMRSRNRFRVECHSADGVLLWAEEQYNTVTTEGLNDLLTKYFKGSSYTAAWFLGLIDNASFGALSSGDTAAKIITSASVNSPTTNNWGESSAYSESTRQTLTFGSASGGSLDNSASKATFTMNATKTINGVFTVTTSTKNGTTGVLFSVVSFGTAQPVISGNVLTVTSTKSVS